MCNTFDDQQQKEKGAALFFCSFLLLLQKIGSATKQMYSFFFFFLLYALKQKLGQKGLKYPDSDEWKIQMGTTVIITELKEMVYIHPHSKNKSFLFIFSLSSLHVSSLLHFILTTHFLPA